MVSGVLAHARSLVQESQSASMIAAGRALLDTPTADRIARRDAGQNSVAHRCRTGRTLIRDLDEVGKYGEGLGLLQASIGV